MPQLIRRFSDGSILEYDEGRFDSWCVYLTRPQQDRYAPQDFQYFERLIQYASIYGNDKVYNDFVSIYNITGNEIQNTVFERIDEIASEYGDFAIDISIDFSIIYMGMIAEENKEFTRLGKRVKLLGVYQILQEGMSSRQAANYSRGLGWRVIDRLCSDRGF